MRVLILTPWSLHHAHGGASRVAALEEAIAKAGHEPHVLSVEMPTGGSPSARERTPTVSRIRQMMLPVPLIRFGPNPRRLRALAVSTDPLSVDAVVAIQLHALAAARRFKVPIWLDLPDRLSGIAARTTSEGGIRRIGPRLQAAQLRRVELSAYAASAACTFAGFEDWEEAHCQGAWMPNPIRLNSDARARPVELPSVIRRVGFIGNMHYLPNRRALRALDNEWAPLLELMGVGCTVAGFGLDSLRPVLRNVEVLGEVESLDRFYRSVDAIISPVTEGGGIKIKVIEALCYGKPVIACRESVAGGGPRVADAVEVVPRHPSASDFERAISDVARRGAAAWATAVENIRKEFSFAAFQVHVDSALELLQTTPYPVRWRGPGR